ncbi:MAG: alpha/beta hydrolase, partial [Propionibacteriaceae bacterium]|nr:alpha/beta hydrolase [Propionibacteriaceae bacterium]
RAKIAGFGGPTLIMHTRFDGLVDVSHAERLMEWAGGDARLRVFDRGDHNTILWRNTEAYRAEVAALLERARPTRAET